LFPDDGGNGTGGGCGAESLQVAASAEGAAFTLDHEHPDGVIGFHLGAKLFQPFRNRQVDRVESRRPVQRDGGDRAFHT
jgi:hypothetical protein